MCRICAIFLLGYSLAFSQKVPLTLFTFTDVSKVSEKQIPKNTQNKITVFHGDPFKLDDRMIEKLNDLKIDFAAVGKSILGTRISFMKKNFAKMRFPLFCCNLLSIDETLPLRGDQTVVWDFEEIKVGAFSVVCQKRANFLKKYQNYLLISDSYACQEKIKELRKQGVEVVIMFAEDAQNAKLLEQLDGVDIMVCLDAKQEMSFYEGKTLIYHFVNEGSSAHRIDLFLEKRSTLKGDVIELYPF